MCGIAGGFGLSERDAAKMELSLKHRGPDANGFERLGRLFLVHTRLSIMDLDRRSDQPFRFGDAVLTYNGELWNHRELRDELISLGRKFRTTGDTEVFAACVNEWGTDALPKMQGMFSAAWTTDGGRTLFLTRDRHGETPLHVAGSGNEFAFASEIRALLAVGFRAETICHVEPGTFIESDGVRERTVRWYEVLTKRAPTSLDESAPLVRAALTTGAEERLMSDVPVCCLLSGGIDSAAVAFLLSRKLPRLVAYVAVMNPKSRDLRCARETAEALGIELREVKVEPPTADDLSGVVRRIEMPHKAQVEIGWACAALADQMAADGFKVTYSGEGSDELWGSYGMSFHGIKKLGFGEYRRRLFHDQHRKNFMRCNKVFMARGVECRLPFLNTGLVELALSLPQSAVAEKNRPKAVMQEAFRGSLPASVVDRPKMAFQDGCGLQEACTRAVADPARFYRLEFNRFLLQKGSVT